jgi:hypothetical protein
LVLLPVMANEPSLFSTSFSSKARRRRETIPIDEQVGTGRPLFEKCISGYLTGSLWSRRSCLRMSANDPKRTLQRGSLSEGNVAAPSAWQQITVCSNCPS